MNSIFSLSTHTFSYKMLKKVINLSERKKYIIFIINNDFFHAESFPLHNNTLLVYSFFVCLLGLYVRLVLHLFIRLSSFIFIIKIYIKFFLLFYFKWIIIVGKLCYNWGLFSFGSRFIDITYFYTVFDELSFAPLLETVMGVYIFYSKLHIESYTFWRNLFGQRSFDQL